MYKIVICDIDGTLVNFKGEISEENVRAIRKLKDNGIEFALCTGRQGKYARNILNRLGIEGYVIASCGSEILDMQGNIIHSESINLNSIKELINYCEENDILNSTLHNGFILTKNRATIVEQLVSLSKTITKDPEEVLRYTEAFLKDLYLDCNIVDNPIKVIEQENLDIYKLDIINTDFEKLNYIRALVDEIDDLVHVSSFPTIVEVGRKGIDKGVAVKKLCHHLKIGLEEAMAIGDSNNDEAMLKVVGMPVAMGNATDYIKSICKMVTKNCNDSGVADAINKLII